MCLRLRHIFSTSICANVFGLQYIFDVKFLLAHLPPKRVIFITLLKDVISGFVRKSMLAMTSLYHTLSQMSSIQHIIVVNVFKCRYLCDK